MPEEAASPAPVLVVYAGGTFGMRDRGRGLEATPDLREAIAGILGPVAWEYALAPRIEDSSQTGHDGGLALADLIRERVASAPFAGVVVIHGTDTLAFVAAQVAFACADLATPIVFTGSQLPLGAARSDAERNLLDAFACASAPGGRADVTLAFGGRALPAVRATKRSSEDLDAFAAPREPGLPAAGVDPDLAASLAAAASRPAPRIGLLSASPGMPAELVDAAVSAYPEGLVLECFGAGTAPLDEGRVAAAVARAVAAGTPVLAITRCELGAVDLRRYAVGAELADAGAIGGSDLTVEAAVGKLRALSRAGISGQDLARLCSTSLIGEQRPR